ncbi:MAG: hypothetical protein KAQ96_08490 [Thermoplasmata archaeon]|nr:hypothetical protein [Thermoplasmata archaeon]
MKQRYLKDDKIKKGTNVDLGSLMLFDEPEWRARTIGAKRVFNASLFRSYLVVCILLLGIILITPIMAEFTIDAGYSIFILVLVALSSLLFAPMFFAFYRNGRADPVAGLYTEGFLLFNRIFVPYDQVEGIDEKVSGNSILGQVAMVYLVPKGKGKKSSLFLLLGVPKTFLGNEGLDMLHRSIKGTQSGELPPKMVVYGGRGGVAKREYVPEVEDV